LNAVEIEQAVSDLFADPLDAAEFPYAFLQAFGNKETTLKKLRTGDTNKSDAGGLLQRNNIHLAVASPGQVTDKLATLRDSPATARHKVKFILATDGERIEAEDLGGGTPLECAWGEFPNHFGLFLPLAGITTVREIRENAFDIRATSKLNRLYIELLKENPEWGSDERRPDMNHFMARLIFSFFAEDTGIFADRGLFTRTISQMSERDSSNTHAVISIVFMAMNTKHEARQEAAVPRWADRFPYVNGGLFSGSMAVPRFTRAARSYLLQVGGLDWKQINPDIFGSMIQAVADEKERGALGMHYTSVPNILKVLNPLFLDDLRTKLKEAEDNARKLLNLRNRIKRIRVFDPACGSGNFLVIAYKELRAIEHEINRGRGEIGRQSELPLTNFRGIELRDFAAEIARLALIIAEFQCDVIYRGQQEALNDFLPLDSENWITCGNALRLDWLAICPPTGTNVKLVGDDLFSTPLDQPEIDFENAGGETYICGNPPYAGKGKKSKAHLQDMRRLFKPRQKKFGYVDYVGCWFVLASDYCRDANAKAGLVATNSICQGRQVTQLWPGVLRGGVEIEFAHLSFPWANSAMRNAGVICVVVGLAMAQSISQKRLYQGGVSRDVSNINAYLVDGRTVYVNSVPRPIATDLPLMLTGSVLNDDGNLIFDPAGARSLILGFPPAADWLRPFYGSEDYIKGLTRHCLLIPDNDVLLASENAVICERLNRVARARECSDKREAREILALTPHRFQHHAPRPNVQTLIVPSVSSEQREWFPAGLLNRRPVISNLAFLIPDGPLWCLALLSSRVQVVWIATVCGKLKTDFRYSNTLGWNTFPVLPLSLQNKADLTQCAEAILLAREVHYPATIADLYDPKQMPANLREAHERNDQVVERIYIGRQFRNDTERLEKLFDMYTKVTANEQRRARGRGHRGTE
jgi:hypothetical protein